MYKFLFSSLLMLVTALFFLSCSSADAEPEKVKKSWISSALCKVKMKNSECD